MLRYSRREVPWTIDKEFCSTWTESLPCMSTVGISQGSMDRAVSTVLFIVNGIHMVPMGKYISFCTAES